jgi:hypothetical protein
VYKILLPEKFLLALMGLHAMEELKDDLMKETKIMWIIFSYLTYGKIEGQSVEAAVKVVINFLAPKTRVVSWPPEKTSASREELCFRSVQ